MTFNFQPPLLPHLSGHERRVVRLQEIQLIPVVRELEERRHSLRVRFLQAWHSPEGRPNSGEIWEELKAVDQRFTAERAKLAALERQLAA